MAGKAYLGQFHSSRRAILIQECAEQLKNGKQIIYLLPSREAIFSVRQAFMDEIGCLVNILIGTFTDLEKELTLSFTAARTPITTGVQYAVIATAMREIESSYTPLSGKAGVVRGLLSLFSTLSRNMVLSEQLATAADSNGLFSDKCHSISAIWDYYNSEKENKKLYDMTDLAVKAPNAAAGSACLQDVAMIVVDGFFHIDPVNIELLQRISENFPDIAIHINIPFNNPASHEFLKTDILNKLASINIAAEEDAAKNTAVPGGFISLAQKLFSGQVCEGSPDLTITSSPCIEHELRQAARIIKELIVSSGVSPDDIAIYPGRSGIYDKAFREIFSEAGIPIRSDNGKPFADQTLVPFLYALLEFAAVGFHEENFLELVSSRFIFPEDVLNELEWGRLRFLACQIVSAFHPQDWLDRLTHHLNTDEILKDKSEPVIKHLGMLKKFEKSGCKDVETLYEKYKALLSELGVTDAIATIGKTLPDPAIYIGLLQELELFMAILQEKVALHSEYNGDNDCSWPEDFLQDLQEHTVSARYNNSSKDISGVRYITPDLGRGQNYHTIFVLGLNEGVFPSLYSGSTLFSDAELNILADQGISIPNREDTLERENIRFNACLATARTKIYLSYRTAEEDGTYMIPSFYIDEIITALGSEAAQAQKLPVSMRRRMQMPDAPVSCTEYHYQASLAARDNMDTVLELLRNSDACPDAGEAAMKGQQARSFYHREAQGCDLSGIANDSLYGEYISSRLHKYSASQIEKYLDCPFCWYSEKLLKARKEELYLEPTDARQIGSFYHKVLQDYFNNVNDPCVIDEQMFDKVISEHIESIPPGRMPRLLYQKQLQELTAALKNFIDTARDNSLRYRDRCGNTLKPRFCEKEFTYSLEGSDCVITGIVDRIDLEMDQDNKPTGRYVIYDYKKKTIKTVKEIINGEDLQLPVYKMSFEKGMADELARELGGAAPVCLAVFYYSIEAAEWKGILAPEHKELFYEKNKRPQFISQENMEILYQWTEENIKKRIHEMQGLRYRIPDNCRAMASWSGNECIARRICRHE